MTDKPRKHTLSGRAPKSREGEGTTTPIIPIGNSRLADAVKDGGRIYQLMVESVRDYAIFMLDPNGHVASWNRGAQRIKGYSANEIIGQHFSVFYSADDVAAGKPERELELVRRDGTLEDEGFRIRKDGSRFWASVVLTAVRDEDGTLVGIAKVTRDLTERRFAQQQAIADARRVAAAESANVSKSDFLTAMSHELRTPLNAIGGYADLLSLGLGGPVTAKQTEYVERIRRSQQHLLGIISDLLNFSRIEAGQIVYEVAPLVVSKAVDTVITLVEPQALAKGIALERDTSAPDGAAIGDHSKVDQILLNLLSNAIKFTKAGGKIVVRAGFTDNIASISVEDTGCGIPVDQHEAIFEPFVQLGRSLSSAHEGTGLGLSISRDLARAMNGDLTVTSVEGAGSTFTITLPRSF